MGSDLLGIDEEVMKIQRLLRKLAESGRVWIDWEQKSLVFLDDEGIYSFHLQTTDPELLLKFKSSVEYLTGEKLPSNMAELRRLLGELITQSFGSLPHAPR